MKKEKSAGAPEKTSRKPNRNAVYALIFAAVIIFTFLLGFIVRGAAEQDYSRKVSEIIKLIDDTSVYYDEKTADEIASRLVKSLLDNDKYAAYYSPEEYKKILAEDSGNYSGIGVGFAKGEDDTYDGTIGKVFLNSPAHKKGVKKGDKLIAGKFKGQSEYAYFQTLISETKTVLQVISEFFTEFDSGEEINIKVLRGDEEIAISVEKAEYAVSYVEYKDDVTSCYFSADNGKIVYTGEALNGLSPDTAYIKLHEFEGGAATQFGKALEFMKSRNKSRLIIDLRDNGGGHINILTDILSYLINDNGSNNIKIMGVKEKNSESSFMVSANRYNSFLTDVSVIANGSTASASEALIAALNDYGDSAKFGGVNFNLGRLVLTEKHAKRQTYCTYGKGIMQTTYSLKSGGALILTTAYVYSPISNKCIQDIGIETAVAENCVSDEYAISRADLVLH